MDESEIPVLSVVMMKFPEPSISDGACLLCGTAIPRAKGLRVAYLGAWDELSIFTVVGELCEACLESPGVASERASRQAQQHKIAVELLEKVSAALMKGRPAGWPD